MRKLRIFLMMSTLSVSLFTVSNCVVTSKPNNGKHKGWYKNTNNPHHPNTTNPGHTKAKGKPKKGKK